MRLVLLNVLMAVVLAGCSAGANVASPTGGAVPVATNTDIPAPTPPPQVQTPLPTLIATPTPTPAEVPTMAPIPSLAATMIPIDAATVKVVADPSLARLLPERINGVRFVAHDLAAGGPAPAPLDGPRLAQLAGLGSGPTARVSLAWIEAGAGAADRTGGTRVTAVRVAGVSGVELWRSAIALEILGTPTPFVGEHRSSTVDLGGLGATAYVHGDALILLSWTREGPPDVAEAWSPDRVIEALPAVDTIEPVVPSIPGVSGAMASAPPSPVPGAEAMMPRAVAGVPLRYLSAAGAEMWANPLLPIGAYLLLTGGLQADPLGVDVAAGLSALDDSPLGSYMVVMTHVPDASRDALVQAWFANLIQVTGGVEMLDVAGRPVILYDEGRRAVYATKGRLYFMYLFAWMDVPEVPPSGGLTMRDLVIDTVRQIPTGADAGG